jgi:hypothetical protein
MKWGVPGGWGLAMSKTEVGKMLRQFANEVQQDFKGMSDGM